MDAMDATPDSLHGDIWMNKWKWRTEWGKVKWKIKKGERRKEYRERSRRGKRIEWSVRVRIKHNMGLREKWRDKD